VGGIGVSEWSQEEFESLIKAALKKSEAWEELSDQEQSEVDASIAIVDACHQRMTEASPIYKEHIQRLLSNSGSFLDSGFPEASVVINFSALELRATKVVGVYSILSLGRTTN